MAKVSPLQGNFNTGEISPLLQGRVDAERYKSALYICENYIPTIQGGLIRRPGTMFTSEVKTSTKATRLIPFEFSTTQAYMIEVGDLYMRFYKDNALITLTPKTITAATAANPVQITSASHGYSNGDRVVISGILGMTELNNREFIVAGSAANTFTLTDVLGNAINGTAFTAYTSGGTVSKVYEIVSPYPESTLFQIKFTQSADVLYLTHPSYPPKKLTRTAHTTWTIATIDFQNGPYLAENTTTTTFTAGAATGVTTLTASAIAGINNGQGFLSTDVGRLVRIKNGSAAGWAKITGYTSTTIVSITVQSAVPTAGVTTWRMGLWSDTTGYPSCVTFHEDRLFLAGAAISAQRLDGSRSSDYENFASSDNDGTITSSHAVAFAFNANDVNVVRWMTSDEKGLLAGTVGGEWNVRPSTQSEALSPTNINAKRTTSYGSANIQPVQVGKATMFIQRAGRKLREMSYFYDVDGFRASDLTVLSEHITGQGIVQIAYQKEPQSIVWMVREDGALIAMGYERDIESFKVGWSRHVIGGVSDANNSPAIVESVAVIPSSDGTRDEVWIVVKRRINGITKRYVEYITKLFDQSVEQKDAYFVDGGLTYDVPLTITGATAANPVVITAVAHGFSNGDSVLISGVEGMTELNDNSYTVANKTTNTFELSGINGTAYTAYISGGQVRKRVTTLSGLYHLEGQTVSILADGAVQPDVTVSSGRITLTASAATIQVGFNYNSDGQMLRLEAGSADGTALGKTRRTHRVGFLLHRTLGFKIGMNFDELDEVTFRTSSDPMSRAPALFTGILSETISADYDFENQIAWRQDQPLPGMILAIMPQMVTQDRG